MIETEKNKISNLATKMDTDINKIIEFTKKSNTELSSNQQSINSLLVANLKADLDQMMTT